MIESFEDFGKQVYTKNGEFRADFNNSVQRRMLELISQGIDKNNALSYTQTNYPQITRDKIDDAIDEFLANQCSADSQDKSPLTSAFTDDITPEAFLQAAKSITGDLVGVYVIYNETKGMYYVGQAKRLYFRVKQHFTGHGNGDVYADYKYGDSFLIRLITLRESGCDDLDRLERDMIAKYHAYESGYNKNAGNKS